ncbi:isocitrate lyase/PEP mutase family protein [Streptomyces fuscigenes]|uniref:isocitrate lyase/PEP mutase family protein n=1 Tax=Streptomyces fuscigenes TaxID=1528880 RepID=UPI001F2D9E75|nr:isocitrate lyase/phosphoenolpyruvate mutase family protein [Streptomyces fuscigenes]MCF3964254.1 isocitrate lyase/phosphoenolpyruvate mutase family protein [Streptomyces fuscigenes]
MPNSPVDAFRAAHHDRAPEDPLVLPGPWDAGSAQAFRDAGFTALATPSAGVSASLGYEDGELPFEDMFAAVARITRAVDVPVSADLEGGYGLKPEELVERALAAGVVGCNLEDSHRGVLKDPRQHADWLAEVVAAADGALVVNARVDTFITGDTDPASAVERARLYVAAGADCVYPILAPHDALPDLRAGIDGPINAVSNVPGPAHAELGKLGATRITFGPMLHRRAMAAVKELGGEVLGG